MKGKKKSKPKVAVHSLITAGQAAQAIQELVNADLSADTLMVCVEALTKETMREADAGLHALGEGIMGGFSTP